MTAYSVANRFLFLTSGASSSFATCAFFSSLAKFLSLLDRSTSTAVSWPPAAAVVPVVVEDGDDAATAARDDDNTAAAMVAEPTAPLMATLWQVQRGCTGGGVSVFFGGVKQGKTGRGQEKDDDTKIAPSHHHIFAV